MQVLARTIRVAFAAKLLKTQCSMHLVYLVDLVLKLLPVPVSGQHALAGARFRIPQTDRLVLAA